MGDPNNSNQAAHYCVTGSTVADDAAYWMETSDHIANDGVICSEMKKEPKDYHRLMTAVDEKQKGAEGAAKEGKPLFLTEELMKRSTELGGSFVTPPPAPGAIAKQDSEETRETNEQRDQEERSLMHVDFSRLVAGFNIRHPEGGNQRASAFQGVTDTRASQPNQQELDLETLNRVSSDELMRPRVYSFSVGIQTDAEYDRSAQGNLTNKPVNAIYAVNNLSIGAFVQKRIPFWGDAKTAGGDWGNRELPRTLLVITAYQYERQFTGNFIFLNFAAGNGELTVHSLVVTGYARKAGLRHDMAGGKWSFDRGSYAEAGWEYVVQNNIGRSMTLTTTSKSQTKTCHQLSGAAEFLAGFVVQRVFVFEPGKSAEYCGAHALDRGAVVLRPDSGVSFGRMLLFEGPASQDQTKSAKIK